MYRTLVGGDVNSSGGHYSMMWLFAFLIVFFVLLLFMWKKDRHEGGITELLPLILGFAGGKGRVGGGCDDGVLEEERSTRRIMHDVDLQTGRVCKEIETVRVEQKDLALCAEKEKCAQLRSDLSDERNKNYVGTAFGKLSQELDCIKANLPSVVKTFSKPELAGWLEAAESCGK